MRRERPQEVVRQYCGRVVKRHEYGPGGVERMTKELTSVPSKMRIKVVTPPDDIIPTVGTKRFRCAEVLFHRTFPLRGGLAVIPGKTAGLACEERPGAAYSTLRGAARSRTLQEGPSVPCGLAVSPRKPRVPHWGSGQEPHTPGGTKRALRYGGEPRNTAGPDHGPRGHCITGKEIGHRSFFRCSCASRGKHTLHLHLSLGFSPYASCVRSALRYSCACR